MNLFSFPPGACVLEGAQRKKKKKKRYMGIVVDQPVRIACERTRQMRKQTNFRRCTASEEEVGISRVA